MAGATVTLGSAQRPVPTDAGPCRESPSAAFPQGAGSVVNVAGGTTTIDCPISGSMVKNGDGGLTLGGGVEACSSITVGGGVLDLGGTTLALNTVTLTGGAIVDGTLNVAASLEFYCGTVSANLGGTAELDKLGPDTVLLTGNNTYSGGTNVPAGTLIAAYAYSLPSTATGEGTVVVRPTLYWSGNGNWTTDQWQSAAGTPTPWVDGSSVVIAPGSVLAIDGLVDVTRSPSKATRRSLAARSRCPAGAPRSTCSPARR